MGQGHTSPRKTRGKRVPPRLTLLIAAVAALGAAIGPVSAGTVSLTWDPVSDPDLQGYRVYYGSAPGAYTSFQEAGLNTSATVSGLADCSMWYLVVRAVDTGNLEGQDSNVVRGWPRPAVTSVSPRQIVPGQTVSFLVQGLNFDPGVPGDPNHPAAQVALSHTGLLVRSVQVEACGQLRVVIEAPVGTAPGLSDLTVQNPDLSFGTPGLHPWVYGNLAAAIEVIPPDLTAPVITGTDPAAGAQDVPATAPAVVLFSEAVNPSTVTPATVRLLDDQGVPVAQAAGSPITDGARVTITPLAALGEGREYRIQVAGGAGGVTDLAGNPLAQTFTQDPAYKVAGNTQSPNQSATVLSSDPGAGQTDVGLGQAEIEIDFDRDMSPLWRALKLKDLQARFRVLIGGKTVKQAPTSPALRNEGRTVVITLASNLEAGGIYITQVNLTGSKLKTALSKIGALDLLMDRVWSTSPQWAAEEALDDVAYKTQEGNTPLKPGTANVPVENQGVPCAVEFRMTFTRPVAPQSANNSIFKIVDKSKKAVRLASHPQIEPDGMTVVLKPAEPLDPGSTYTIQVRTGKSGLLLKVHNGYALIRNPRLLTVTFTTEVSGTTLGTSLGVAE